ncbi:MAG TPA: acriflavin resistance protein [Firmicutes bacterium]|jgi:hydrophobic/amphiphilic exporter-1 (mainly G- bacteria), HAE1 family|nr:acriflavin resistance protein [Bacillota bacterium]
MSITELSIKRPTFIIVIFIALSLLGLFAYSQLKYELFPDIDIPTVTVTTDYDGASASVVESSVTQKIEDAVSGIDKISTVTSTSREGTSIVTIEFTHDANIDYALADVQRKVYSILKNLPASVGEPTLDKTSMSDQPILTVGFTSNLPDTQFFQLMNDSIASAISQVSGVGQVTISGGREREIQVNLDPQKMQGYGLSPLKILSAIQAANADYPTGKVTDSDNEFSVRLAGKFQSLDELGLCIVGESNGGMVRLRDVADLYDGKKDYNAENQVTIARINGGGQSTIALLIYKQSDANSVEVSRLVRERLKKLEDQYRNYNLKTKIASDTSGFITSAADAVKEDLLFAILLVAGVMVLFLHSFRNSVIVMVAIPTSLVVTFLGMWAFGSSLNIITLLALSLVIGILVDDAIVVLENIYRHLEAGKDQRTAALEGRNEIGFTALSITLVDVVVYLPLTLISGMIGGMLKQLALVIVISTLTSLFVSFTVTPMLASRFSKLQPLTDGTLMGSFGLWFEDLYNRLTDKYLAILRICLHNPGKVLLTAGILFVLALSLIPLGFIGSEFIPQADQGHLFIDLELPAGSKIQQTNGVLQQVENKIFQMAGVATVYAEAGSSSNGTYENYYGYLNVTLLPKSQRKISTLEFGENVRRELRDVVGLKCYISQPNLIYTSGSAPIEVAVTGPSWDTAMDTALEVREMVERIPGTSDVKLSSNNGNPEMSIIVNREKMHNLGLDIDTVGQVLKLELTGNTDSKYTDNGSDYDIDVRLDQASRIHTADIGNLTIPCSSGQMIPLNQFARILPTTGPTDIQRRDRAFSISVTSQAKGRSTGDIGEDISAGLKNVKLPFGVSTTFVGDLKDQADSFLSLALALIAAIIFVYLIMVALYNSFIYPFSVLFAVPLAVIGALLALALTSKTLSVFSLMGVIMLVGLVSKNAILLVDFANRAREEGLTMEEALIAAGKVRLRPILMTTLTMILGMIPLATSSSMGAEFKNGLGWALIGGLTCSMVMTLVIVPVVYTRIEIIREFILQFHAKSHRKSAIRE